MREDEVHIHFVRDPNDRSFQDGEDATANARERLASAMQASCEEADTIRKSHPQNPLTPEASAAHSAYWKKWG